MKRTLPISDKERAFELRFNNHYPSFKPWFQEFRYLYNKDHKRNPWPDTEQTRESLTKIFNRHFTPRQYLGYLRRCGQRFWSRAFYSPFYPRV